MARINWVNKVDVETEQAEKAKEKRIQELKDYLAETDFYFIRELETQEPIPDEVKDRRLAVRQELQDLGL